MASFLSLILLSFKRFKSSTLPVATSYFLQPFQTTMPALSFCPAIIKILYSHFKCFPSAFSVITTMKQDNCLAFRSFQYGFLSFQIFRATFCLLCRRLIITCLYW